ncbi:uncharacterized protein LOC141707524 [Apium graveolens]|uniref:uncharacterized protein LOC141707524 n=1 Tax=Apium graveolens TaxID=4045 RepID=UPI003D792835
MWASGASPGRVLAVPRPVDPKPTRIFLVSAKFHPRRSRRQNTNFNYNHYDDDDEDVVQVAPVSTEPQESFGSSNNMSEKTGKQDQVPTGSDILRALQRATVRKHNNKKNKKKQQQQLRPVVDSKAKLDTISTSIAIDDAPVKPLRIRSDWISRLDDLEARLQDLLHI